MKMIRSIVAWLAAGLLGAGIGHCVWGKMPLEVHCIFLQVAGGFLAFGSAFAWQILRRLDELKNVAGLDQERREFLHRRVESRRGPMLRRWIGSIVTGMIAVGSGQLFKTTMGQQHQWEVVLVGYGALAIGLLTVVLLAWEYQTLSKLGPALNVELKKSSDEQNFLHKLRA